MGRCGSLCMSGCDEGVLQLQGRADIKTRRSVDVKAGVLANKTSLKVLLRVQVVWLEVSKTLVCQ